MEQLINQLPNQLSILFPKSEDIDMYNLKAKCEQLGVNTDSKNNRPITFYFSKDDSSKSEMVTEKTVKNWINAQGTATVFNSKEAYENWEELLYSGYEDNLLLALSILNTPKRPEDKFFALLLAVAINHKKEQVKEIAAQLLSPYLTTEEWKKYAKTGFIDIVYLKFSEKESIKSFIDINYYQFWAKTIFNQHQYFSGEATALSSKNVEKFIKHPDFLKWTKANIKTIKYRIEKGDDLTGLCYLGDNFILPKEIEISAVEPYTLKSNEFPYLDCEILKLKNINPNLDMQRSNPLEKVKTIEWDYATDIYFLADIFPNITSLNLAGNKVQELVLSKIKEQLKSAQLTLRIEDVIPPVIYDCVELTRLIIHRCKVKAFNPAIAKLQKLTALVLDDTLVEEFPTDFFRLPDVEFMYGISTSREEIDFRKDHQYYGPNRLFFIGKQVNFFPYGLASLEGLNELHFRNTNIEVLDKRILKFKSLQNLSFEFHKLTKIPDFLLMLEKLRTLYFYSGKIATISFEWINHINQKGINLILSGNPINFLPSIPDSFDMGKIIKNNGQISFTKGSLPLEQIERYKAIFGEKFISC